jgi:hypothetical protein
LLVNVWVASITIGAFVALVGGLIYLGVRQRPMLEIRAKPWGESPPLPAWLGRLRIAGLLSFVTGVLLFLVMGWLGFRTAGRILVAIGWSFYFASLVIRIAVLAWLALKSRKDPKAVRGKRGLG